MRYYPLRHDTPRWYWKVLRIVSVSHITCHVGGIISCWNVYFNGISTDDYMCHLGKSIAKETRSLHSVSQWARESVLNFSLLNMHVWQSLFLHSYQLHQHTRWNCRWTSQWGVSNVKLSNVIFLNPGHCVHVYLYTQVMEILFWHIQSLVEVSS